MNIKLSIWISVVLLSAVMMTSCTPVNPAEEPEVQELVIDPDSCLAAMLRYFPYTKTDTLVYANESSKKQWIIYPHTNWNPGAGFPVVNKGGGEEGPSSWYNMIAAPFVVEGIGNLYRTEFYWELSTSSGKFEFLMSNDIRFEQGSYYSGNLNTRMDSAQLRAFFADTIVIPIKSLEPDKSGKSEPMPQGAELHFVKDKGLTEFSLDGTTFWRRTDVTTK